MSNWQLPKNYGIISGDEVVIKDIPRYIYKLTIHSLGRIGKMKLYEFEEDVSADVTNRFELTGKVVDIDALTTLELFNDLRCQYYAHLERSEKEVNYLFKN